MKRVIIEPNQNEVVNIQDVNHDKYYAWKGDHGWYKIQYIGSRYLSINTGASPHCSLSHGVNKTLKEVIKMIIINDRQVFEFDIAKEMSDYINKNE